MGGGRAAAATYIVLMMLVFESIKELWSFNNSNREFGRWQHFSTQRSYLHLKELAGFQSVRLTTFFLTLPAPNQDDQLLIWLKVCKIFNFLRKAHFVLVACLQTFFCVRSFSYKPPPGKVVDKNAMFLTTLMSWMKANPKATSTFCVMFCTGLMSLL